jgi:hypothetical protein
MTKRPLPQGELRNFGLRNKPRTTAFIPLSIEIGTAIGRPLTSVRIGQIDTRKSPAGKALPQRLSLIAQLPRSLIRYHNRRAD